MPGFTAPYDSANQAGLTVKAQATSETKRKHRWVFTVFWTGGAGGGGTSVNGLNVTSVYLQNAQRPHAVVDVPEMHHDEEVAYFAGKYHWEPVNLVFYDVLNPINSSDRIYEWFNRVINVSNATVSPPAEYKKECQLDMTDGQGSSIEKWTMHNCWPFDVNWNDLDYTSTEIQTIDVSMRFDRAELTAAAGTAGGVGGTSAI